MQFKGFDHFDLDAEGRAMKKQVQQWTGIPVSVGIAPSKALAKLPIKLRKNTALKPEGVYVMANRRATGKSPKMDWCKRYLGHWSPTRKTPRSQGVKTAFDFSNLPDSWIRKHMSVLELRLKKDLLGLPYIQLEDQPSKKIHCHYP